MENCLITKLKGSVNNTDLSFLGAIKIETRKNADKNGIIRMSNSVNWKLIKADGTILTEGNGNFSYTSFPDEDATYYLLNARYCGTIEFSFDNTGISVIKINSEELKFTEPVKIWSGNTIYGSAENLLNSNIISIIDAIPSTLTIDLEDEKWQNVPLLKTISIKESRYSGNILRLSNATSLEAFDTGSGNGLTGSIEELAAAQVTNGRTSGSIKITAPRSTITHYDNIINLNYIRQYAPNGWGVLILFSSDFTAGFRTKIGDTVFDNKGNIIS